MKDYYRILGILDDAEDIIIRAAYKALAQRYHPDKWKGDKEEANKRMQDINEAYEVLSDIEKRKQYDEGYFKSKPRDDAQSESSSSEFKEEEEEFNETWKMALEFFPIIQEEFNELKLISGILANTFKNALISSQEFRNSSKLKKKYESDYLHRFYGSDVQIQEFAKTLLLNKNHNAAIKVNKIIRLLGNSVTFDQVYEKINKEFPQKSNFSSSNRRRTSTDDTITTLIEKAQSDMLNEREAILLIKKLWNVQVTISTAGFSNTYRFEHLDERKSLSFRSLKKYIKDHL